MNEADPHPDAAEMPVVAAAPDATPPGDSTADPAATDTAPDAEAARAPLDLDAIERDLSGVEVALGRLDDGSYWTDEVTGDPIPDDALAADPVARRAG